MINRDNWKLYKRYLAHLADVKQLDGLTVDKYRKELAYLLEWADENTLAQAPSIRPPFPKFVASSDGNDDGKPLTTAYARRVCAAARVFLQWVRMTEGGPYRELTERWLETLTTQRVRQGRVIEHEFYTVEEIRRLLALPADTLLRQRDQAAAAFLFLSGMRIGAFVTLTLKCVNVEKRWVKQWPDLGVVTKNRKAATTYLLDIPDLLETVSRWDALLRHRRPERELWYPVLTRDGMKITEGKPATPERSTDFYRGLKRLCEAADVEFKSPHKLRHGHTMYALAGAETIADLKAVSQNLMHASVTITDQVYGVLSGDDVADRISALGRNHGRGRGAPPEGADDQFNRLVAEVAARIKDK